MTLGWQGFRFDHPDDWAPVSLVGSEREGYIRLASSGRIALQLRWRTHKAGLALDGLLDSYRKTLERDSKKSREPFHFSTHKEAETDLVYHWTGAGQGRGCLFYSPSCSRVFFLEVIGARKDQLLPHLRQVRDCFRSGSEPTRLWSVLGLQVALPSDLKLEKHLFQAGKTQLSFIARGARVECTRWGFAEQLLSKRTLIEWASAFLELPKATIREELHGLRLSSISPLAKKEALVTLQPEHNQIIAMKASYRKEERRPSWDWLV